MIVALGVSTVLLVRFAIAQVTGDDDAIGGALRVDSRAELSLCVGSEGAVPSDAQVNRLRDWRSSRWRGWANRRPGEVRLRTRGETAECSL